MGHRRGWDPTLLWLWHRPVGYSSDSSPGLGTSICRGSGSRKHKKTKKKKKKTVVDGPQTLQPNERQVTHVKLGQLFLNHPQNLEVLQAFSVGPKSQNHFHKAKTVDLFHFVDSCTNGVNTIVINCRHLSRNQSSDVKANYSWYSVFFTLHSWHTKFKTNLRQRSKSY